MSKPLFTLANINYTQKEMMTFAEVTTRGHFLGPRMSVVHDLYNMYVQQVLTDFQENKLMDEKEDFRNLMTEYHDGIMLFELMDQNVWGKASKDSVGLRAYYDEHKSKYMWDAGFVGSVYHFKDEEAMKKGVALLKKKKTKDEDIIKAINNDHTTDGVTIQQGHFEYAKFKDVAKENIVKGKISEPSKVAPGGYTVVKADETFDAPNQKSLEDARGYVVAEYQDFLEKKWNEMLRNKYPVKVDEAVLQSTFQK
jgi:peptidyl-prolyl cis-trans isomerase SurA